MKQIVSSLVIAFSMYSKIPMPKVEWSKENMRYAMCFFPLVGAVLGGVVYLWCSFSNVLAMSRVFNTVIVILIPLLLTGGIHMDGFLDTTDALSSYQPREKKLEILKDPNTGAFAVIACVSYFLLTFGFWYEITPDTIPMVAIGFVVSRAFSGLAVVSFPMAKSSGLAATFSSEANKKLTRIVMISFLLLAACGMLLINWKLGLLCLLGVLLLFIYYYRMSTKEFGGITGDLAGYFLQLCELTIVICVVLGGKLCG
jgi:adenosylcobinamide-GDP ribazoletransferase